MWQETPRRIARLMARRGEALEVEHRRQRQLLGHAVAWMVAPHRKKGAAPIRWDDVFPDPPDEDVDVDAEQLGEVMRAWVTAMGGTDLTAEA